MSSPGAADTVVRYPPEGYRVVLPPGWLRLPVRHRAPAVALDEVLGEAFAELPADRYGPVRRQLRDLALPLLEQARADGALDVWVPLFVVRGLAVPASVLVRDLTLPSAPDVPDRAETTAGLLAAVAGGAAADGGEGQVVTLPAGPSARTVLTRPADDVADRPAAVQVTHHLPLPHDPERWVIVTLAVPAQHDPVTTTLIELFDAMMTTWRWREPSVTL